MPDKVLIPAGFIVKTRDAQNDNHQGFFYMSLPIYASLARLYLGTQGEAENVFNPLAFQVPLSPNQVAET
jgi:hypothetical protein